MFTKKQLLSHILIAVLAITVGSGIMWIMQANAVDINTNCSEGEMDPYYLDADDDGYGDPAQSVMACTKPEGYSVNDLDCDDSVVYVNPGVEESCDAYDNDCDGLVNEGIATSTYYLDYDHDGYGLASSTFVWCALPVSYASSTGDCDDNSPETNPGAEEICDGLDNDCNGLIDDGLATSTFYIDSDNDGYGSTASTTVSCAAPEGFVENNNDCNDASAIIYPGAAELCDGLNNDCDGEVDEGCASSTVFYRDADGDDYGNPALSVEAVTQPVGYVVDNTDCDDSNADKNPGETEVCDGLDNDCDGEVDEGVKLTWYWDADADAYGISASTTLACSAPEGYAGDDNDCDDSDANINPSEEEVCFDSIDNNCDGDVDEACGLNTYYQDNDGDSYGNINNTKEATTTPDGYVSDSSDCNDNNVNIYPGATEVCDGIDNDCDGTTDEGCSGLNTYYRDADGDGYGDPNDYIEANALPSCYVENNNDCNDDKSSVHPGATEKCDGIDNDCDGDVDEDCGGSGGDGDCDCSCQCQCDCDCGDGCDGDNCNNNNYNHNYSNNNEEPADCGSPSDYKNHGGWVSCVAHLTNWFKKEGNISGQEKGRVMSWAAKQKSDSFEFNFKVKNNNKNKDKYKKNKGGDDDDDDNDD